MSDFFSNLLARSFKDAPAIQPRLPSRFEAGGPETFSENQTSAESVAAPAHQKKSGRPSNVEKKSREFFQSKTGPAGKNNLPVADEPTAELTSPASHFEAGKIRPVDSLAISGKNSPTTVEPAISPAAKPLDEKLFSERPRGIPRRMLAAPFEAKPASVAPTINVTIGRVEVRAIQETAIKSKSFKAAPPKLSLDDYLKKSDGGGR